MGVLILNPGVSSLELKKCRTFCTHDCRRGLEGTWKRMEDFEALLPRTVSFMVAGAQQE